MNVGELNSHDQKPSSSFIDFISNLNFLNTYKKASSESNSKIIKVGEMTYKVIEEAQTTDEENMITQNEFKRSDNKNEKTEDSQQDGSNEYITPILQVQIIPIQADHFLAQLPVHLSRFIKDLVSIVKQYNIQSRTMDYHFKFNDLNMSVICSKKEDALTIVIQVGDEALQKELNKKHQDHMISYLKTELDSEKVDVKFEFVKEEKKSNQQDSQQQEHNKEHSNDTTKESEEV
jgi:hypothetical protein